MTQSSFFVRLLNPCPPRTCAHVDSKLSVQVDLIVFFIGAGASLATKKEKKKDKEGKKKDKDGKKKDKKAKESELVDLDTTVCAPLYLKARFTKFCIAKGPKVTDGETKGPNG